MVKDVEPQYKIPRGFYLGVPREVSNVVLPSRFVPIIEAAHMGDLQKGEILTFDRHR